MRWSYTQDATSSGRGIYLDGILVRDGRRVLVDTGRRTGSTVIQASGWSPAIR